MPSRFFSRRGKSSRRKKEKESEPAAAAAADDPADGNAAVASGSDTAVGAAADTAAILTPPQSTEPLMVDGESGAAAPLASPPPWARVLSAEQEAEVASWKKQRTELAEKTALQNVRKPIIRKADHANAFLIDCPTGCTTWYTLSPMTADFSTKAAFPEPDGDGVLKASGAGPFETESFELQDGTTSMVCRAVAVRNDDGKKSGLAGLEVPTYPAQGPLVELNDQTGMVTVQPAAAILEADKVDFTFEWRYQASTDAWAPYTEPLCPTEHGVILARSQTVWCTRSAVEKFTVPQAPPPRMVPVLDKATAKPIAFKVFDADMGGSVRVCYAWDEAADPASRECVDDTIEVDTHRAGERRLSVLVFQSNRLPYRHVMDVIVPQLPPLRLGDTEEVDGKGLQVTVDGPAGFPQAKLYYSWNKTAIAGKDGGCTRVIGRKVPVITNRVGSRTLSVIASYPGHTSSSTKRSYDVGRSSQPAITVASHHPEPTDDDAAFGLTELVGSHVVTIEHDNAFANIVYCFAPPGDAAAKPFVLYSKPFTLEADRELVVSAQAVTPGDVPSEVATLHLPRVTVAIDVPRATPPTVAKNPDGATLSSVSDNDMIHFHWIINGDKGKAVTCPSGTTVPLDTEALGEHNLVACTTAEGVDESESVVTTFYVGQLPEPVVVSMDRGNGILFKPYNLKGEKRRGNADVLPDVDDGNVDVLCAFGVSKKGGRLLPDSPELTWTSPRVQDLDAWRPVPRDLRGKIAPLPFLGKEYLPQTSILDQHGLYLHIWARTICPGWAPSKMLVREAVKIEKIPASQNEDVSLRRVEAPSVGFVRHEPEPVAFDEKLKTAADATVPMELMPRCFHPLSIEDGAALLTAQAKEYGFGDTHILVPHPEKERSFLILTTGTAKRYAVDVLDDGHFAVEGIKYGEHRNLIKFMDAITKPGSFKVDLGKPILNDFSKQQVEREQEVSTAQSRHEEVLRLAKEAKVRQKEEALAKQEADQQAKAVAAEEAEPKDLKKQVKRMVVKREQAELEAAEAANRMQVLDEQSKAIGIAPNDGGDAKVLDDQRTSLAPPHASKSRQGHAIADNGDSDKRVSHETRQTKLSPPTPPEENMQAFTADVQEAYEAPEVIKRATTQPTDTQAAGQSAHSDEGGDSDDSIYADAELAKSKSKAAASKAQASRAAAHAASKDAAPHARTPEEPGTKATKKKVATMVVKVIRNAGEKWGFGLAKTADGFGTIASVKEIGAASRVKQIVAGARVFEFDGKPMKSLDLKAIAVSMKTKTEITLRIGRPAARAAPPQDDNGEYSKFVSQKDADPELPPIPRKVGPKQATKQRSGPAAKGASASAKKQSEKHPSKQVVKQPPQGTTRQSIKQTAKQSTRPTPEKRQLTEESARQPGKQPARSPSQQPKRQLTKESARQSAKQPATAAAKAVSQQPKGKLTKESARQSSKQPARSPVKQPLKKSARQSSGQVTQQSAKQPPGQQARKGAKTNSVASADDEGNYGVPSISNKKGSAKGRPKAQRVPAPVRPPKASAEAEYVMPSPRQQTSKQGSSKKAKRVAPAPAEDEDDSMYVVPSLKKDNKERPSQDRARKGSKQK
mmetsp:Transcript_14703/g.43509  ORF Transcript_14703/g.43509 Transcript_14703/m.43509 type:complete len:1588 (-) Transcript_14703:69-4832(-)